MMSNEYPSLSEAGPAPLLRDVSDLRRLRRRTGRSLASISERTGIPVSLLRQLEWGLFCNWPDIDSAEEYLRTYAAEAGLEPARVLAVVWPTLMAQREHGAAGAEVEAEAGDAGHAPTGPDAAHRSWRRSGLAALVAMIATLIVFLLVTGAWRTVGPLGGKTTASASAGPTVRVEMETVRPTWILHDPAGHPQEVAATGPESPVPIAAGRARPAPRPAQVTDAAPAPDSTAASRRGGLVGVTLRDEARAGRGPRPGGFRAAVGRIIAGDGTHQVQPFPQPRRHSDRR
jgi:hypothetical protein